MVDEPQVAVDFGSVVAAPYVKMIMEDTLRYLGVEPIFDDETKAHTRKVLVPDVRGKDLVEASRELKAAGLQYLSEETGTIVVDQMPKPGAEVMVNTTVLLYMDRPGGNSDGHQHEPDQGEMVAVPDLKNRSIREANSILTNLGLKLRIEGAGLAVDQDPPQGTMVEPGSEIRVTLSYQNKGI